MSSVWSLESSGTASADRSRGWSSLECLLSSAIYPETTKGPTALATFWRRERDDSNQLWLIRPLQGCAALRLGSKRSDGRVWSNPGGFLSPAFAFRNNKGPIGPLLFLKAIEVDEEPLGFDQTRPSERLEPSRKAAKPCKGRMSQS